MIHIRVEFYGIARQRAGASQVELTVPGIDVRLADVLSRLEAELPAFASQCLVAGTLAPSLTMNLDGQRFVKDLATPVGDGQSVLILSADAGG